MRAWSYNIRAEFHEVDLRLDRICAMIGQICNKHHETPPLGVGKYKTWGDMNKTCQGNSTSVKQIET